MRARQYEVGPDQQRPTRPIAKQTSVPPPELELQAAAGNRTTRSAIARMEVGSVDDPLEREADRAAADVLRKLDADVRTREHTPPGVVSRTAAPGSGTAIGPEGGELDDRTATQIEQRRAGGERLHSAIRNPLERAFNRDLGDVRVHTDGESAALNRRLGARAFTTGNDIFFGAGEYRPGVRAGQQVLAHEVAHTLQQSPGARRTVRRMPSAAQMVRETGQEPKEDKKIGIGKLKFTKQMSTRYKAVLDALTEYRTYVSATKIGLDNATVQAQARQIYQLLEAIYQACLKYNKNHDQGAVATYCADLMSTIGLERVLVADIAGRFGRAPRNEFGAMMSPTWLLEIPDKFTPKNTPSKPTTLSAQQSGQGQGAQKIIPKVNTQSGYQGYFAKDMKFTDFADQMGVGNMMDEYGIDRENPRLAARSVAMSRLDQLLGAGVIAQTEFAVKDGQFGTIMEDAGAQGAKSMKEETGNIDPANDANLQRLLSRLQLIDAIAGQVDRHMGNYFVQKDDSGRVIKVTGIDLDMSFGTQGFEVDKKLKFDWYPGLSKYIDAELAERIMRIKASDLQTIWTGLLTDGEIQAAIARWEALKIELAKLKKAGKLLKPNQWNAKTAREMDAEQKSYVAHIMNARGGSRDPKFAPDAE